MEILENGMVSVRFTMGEAPLLYHDAIVMPLDQYEALTPEEVQAIQNQRYNDWYAAVTAVPDPDTPVVTEPTQDVPSEGA